MRLYVPSLGDKMQLTSDWSFMLFRETRNDSLWRLFPSVPTVTPDVKRCDEIEKQLRER